MNFTNTDCVLKNWSRYKVFSRFTWQVPGQMLSQLNDQMLSQVSDQVLSQVSDQVNDQMDGQVFYQINPIKTKIKEDLIKFHKTIV